MGNHAGVSKEGITLAEVETAMRDVAGEHFPGIFKVLNREGWLSLTFSRTKWRKEIQHSSATFLDWCLEEGVYEHPTVGGNHPSCGIVGHTGYWLLIVFKHGIAEKISGTCFDESDERLHSPNLERYNTLRKYLSIGIEWTSRTLEQAIALERENIPDCMLPWFEELILR